MKHITTYIVTVVFVLMTSQAWAGNVSIPNTFTSGTKAVAADVNANFTAVKTAVDDNNSQIAALKSQLATLQTSLTDANNAISALQSNLTTANTTIATLQSQVSAVNNSNVMALDPYLTVDTVSDSRGPLVRFTGVNMQLVNGTGTTTGAPNGLGNFIIGYDEARTGTTYFCSYGAYTNQTDCENNGFTWAVSLKGGSHYLVVGSQNNYSQYGGIISGYRNTSNRLYANVSGGRYNIASGSSSSVCGGYHNTASGDYSSVSGGYLNTANEYYSSVSGGSGNTASGSSSSVSGGNSRTASGQYNWVAGTYSATQ